VEREKIANIVQEGLPSFGFNNSLNPFEDDFGNGKWAADIAEEITYSLIVAGVINIKKD